MKVFETINRAFNNTFKPGELSLGIVVPIENYADSTVPTMQQHLRLVQKVEELGFKALWLRDVPLHVPSFGDAGQTFDPFTYLGFLAGHTSEIALGIASIALPLHHPVHVAKSATTIDQLSEGRMILGVASGDRYEEYPAMNVSYEERGKLFQEAFQYLRLAQQSFPVSEDNHFGVLNGQSDILPKPFGDKLPILITGNSRQTTDWIADNGDGWMYYPRNFYMQEYNISEWRKLIPRDQLFDKPFMQPLYIDLHEDDDFKPVGIHLGFRIGVNYLIEYFERSREIGVNHIAVNLRFNSNNIEQTLERLAKKVLPHFHPSKSVTVNV